MSAMFRVRKSLLGKCILQKFDGDIVKGPPPGFRDVPWQPNIGAFTVVPHKEWEATQRRIEEADKRAAAQRKARADRKQRDFEASRMPEE